MTRVPMGDGPPRPRASVAPQSADPTILLLWIARHLVSKRSRNACHINTWVRLGVLAEGAVSRQCVFPSEENEASFAVGAYERIRNSSQNDRESDWEKIGRVLEQAFNA